MANPVFKVLAALVWIS